MNIELHVDQTTQTPLYKQIVEQVKQLIATNQLQPGEHLPTVRQLAHSLHINPGTVVRAYLILEQERIVTSRRGGGTMVSARANEPAVLKARQVRLSNLVNSSILEVLGQGYSPEELEAVFHLHLTRWREEQRDRAELLESENIKIERRSDILIVASHDLALNLLINQLRRQIPETSIDITYAGSLGGLIALQENRADLAGIHLLDDETGEYNYPYVKHILPGREMAIVHLAYRIQGLMFAKDNPRQIRKIADLTRPEITFINRQKGSGTRVLLDLELRRQGITSSEIRGYDREVATHLAVATAIARGEADVGLGIEAAALACDLGFMPLFKERYDLVIPIANYRSKLFSPLLEIIASEEFKSVVTKIGGYDTSQTGVTTLL